jgi:L-threonylcarbamoyladenylate synthase
VYGLATSALSPEGIARIYAGKGRSPEKPLQVLCSPSAAKTLGVIPPAAERVIEKIWPGHVGFVVPRRSPQLKRAAAPDDTVLLVCPNWVASLLSTEAGVPVVATSANASGEPEILIPDEAERRFVGSVDAMLDGGVQTGQLNTLLDLSRRPYRVLRKGGLEAEAILAMLADEGEK